MAINFEAANMAGYNNPKIEVFKVVANLETIAITSAPSKSEIKSCLNRGAIPTILLTTPAGSESNLLQIYALVTTTEGDSIYFNNIAYILEYPLDSDSPVLSTGG